jgi:hypothetical protein
VTWQAKEHFRVTAITNLSNMPKTYHAPLFCAYCVGNTIYGILMLYSYLAGVVTQNLTPASLAVITIAISFRVTAIALQWAIWSIKLPGEGDYNQYAEIPFDRLAIMEACYPVLICIAVTMRLLVHLMETDCDASDGTALFLLCDKYYEQGGISVMLFVELVFTPVIAFSLLRDIRQEAIAASWTLGCAVLVVYAAYLQSLDLAIATVMYMLISLLLYVDTQLRLKKTLTLVHQLQDTLVDNQRLALEAQGIELRAMIGNIAHDLKSVSLTPTVVALAFWVYHYILVLRACSL